MSGRSGAAHNRGAAPGPGPLKATIPYHQLASKPRPGRRDGRPAGRSKAQQPRSGMRRTMSLDAIISPYLQGHWPGQGSIARKDKCTQTPDSWSDRTQSNSSSSSSSSGSGGVTGTGHKRSASWGTEHLQEIAKLKQQLQQQRSKPGVSGGRDREQPPGGCSLGTAQTQPVAIPMAPLLTLVPRLRCSVEGLNQELEGMFICQPAHPQPRLLEVPDGHRAPVPLQRCSSGSETEPTSGTPFSSSSASSSPCASPVCISTSLPDPEDSHLDSHHDASQTSCSSPLSSQSDVDLSVPPPPPLLLLSTSPGPNKSCCFQREPPEGCEKVRVWEETTTPRHPKPVLISSCPDPNKVNFTPHGGSAFCPVSLLKPLLPSMDLLFCSLSVSAGGSGGCPGQGSRSCQAIPAPTSRATTGDTPAVDGPPGLHQSSGLNALI